MASLSRRLANLNSQPHPWMWLILLLGTTPLALSYCVPYCSCRTAEEGLYVDCSERNFTGFPDIPDELYGKIVYLDLSRNSLTVLPEKPPRLNALRHLLLSGNALQRLPKRWLLTLSQLTVLDVSANPHLPLQALGDGALVYAHHLQKLNASHAEVEGEVKGSYTPLYSNSLEVLDLSWRRLTEARSSLLVGLPKLRSLDLSGNQLSGGVRLNSSSLEELRVARTGLDSLPPSTLLDLPNLRSLDVSGNRGFSFLTSGGVLSESLIELRARHCELRLQSLKAFPNLLYANLQHNSVQAIQNASFDNPKLVELDLSNNNIYHIHSAALTYLPKLTILNLANNKILNLHPDVFAANAFLEYVNISRNLLVDLGELKADSLEILDVSQCSLAALSAHSLLKFPAIRWLDLSSNRLESLPDNLTSSSLWSLNVSNCRLSAVGNDTFRQLPALQSLSLAGNRFTEPPNPSYFTGNTRLRSLRLHDNPWRCDCASNGFKEFVEYMIRVDQDEVTKRARCVSPPSAEGSTLLQACFDVWYPPPDERSSVHRFGATILSVVAVGGGALLLVSALRSSLRRRRKDRERRRQEEMERRLEERERELRHQLRSEMDDDDDSVFRGPRSRPHRTPSTMTQPPTYEEAVLLSRSQEDLLNESLAGGPATAGSPGTAAVASLATSTMVAPASVTCARHLAYDVEGEPFPKPRPAKPPRKTGKGASGERLSAVLVHSNGNPSCSLANVQIEAPSYTRSAGDISEVVDNERSVIAELRSATGQAGDGVSGSVSSRDGLSYESYQLPTDTPTAATAAVGHPVTPAASANGQIQPSPPPYESAGGSESSSNLSTPAQLPRRQRPLSAYSSDASGEESDESRTPRETAHCAS